MPFIAGAVGVVLILLIIIYYANNKKCVKCGKRISVRVSHCVHCGVRQSQACVRCGNIVSDPEQEYCDECGTKIYWRFDK